jgi:hypothetical protein
MHVAFDRKAEASLDRLNFREADVAELRRSKPEVAKTKRSSRAIWVRFAEQPGRWSIRSEEFHHRKVVNAIVDSVHQQFDAICDRQWREILH